MEENKEGLQDFFDNPEKYENESFEEDGNVFLAALSADNNEEGGNSADDGDENDKRDYNNAENLNDGENDDDGGFPDGGENDFENNNQDNFQDGAEGGGSVDEFSNNNENGAEAVDGFSGDNENNNSGADENESIDGFSGGNENDDFHNAENGGNNEAPPDIANAESDDDDGEEFIPAQKTKPGKLLEKKPPLLNKNFILAAIVGVFSVFLLFSTFVIPFIKKQKAAENEKRLALRETRDTDFSALASKRPKLPLEETDMPVNLDENNFDDYEDIPDPRDAPGFKQIYEVSPQNQPQTSTYSAPSGPTLSQRMAENMNKSISGIKGLSGTRKEEAENTAASAVDNPYAKFGLPAKEEYAERLLSQYGGDNLQVRQGTLNAAPDNYAAQNDQNGKTAFTNAGRENAGDGQYLSPSSVWMGTIFESVLTSAINTDLPGECAAMVTKNVYSSQDGRYLIIPQNSKLFGTYNSSISYSQSRVQIGWHTLIRPDGYQINLGNMNAADPQGATGIAGIINDHPLAYLKALGLMSVFNIVSREYNAQNGNTNNPYIQDLIAASMDVTNKLGEKLIDRALNIQPTIKIKEGTKINIVVNHTLYLPPLDPYKVSMRYTRN